jgi:hypothetical protein
MKQMTIVGLIVIAVALAARFDGAEAGCWNYVTGSRCDNEGAWGMVGYMTCTEKCDDMGYNGGTCQKNVERCFGYSRNVNVCRCN